MLKSLFIIFAIPVGATLAIGGMWGAVVFMGNYPSWNPVGIYLPMVCLVVGMGGWFYFVAGFFNLVIKN